MRIAAGNELWKLEKGEMKFIPHGTSVKAILSADGELMNAYFDVIDFICDKISLQQLGELKQTVDYDPEPLEVRGGYTLPTNYPQDIP